MTNCILRNFSSGISLSRDGSMLTMNNCEISEVGEYNGISVSSESNLEIHNSNIYNCGLYTILNSGTYDQDATSNWWGTTDTTEIESSILDYLDNSNYGTVDYASYLTSEATVTGCGW